MKRKLIKLNANKLALKNAQQQLALWFKKQLRAIRKLERDDLDLANAGQWPDLIKIIALISLIASVVFASHWLLISNYREELIASRQEQAELLEAYGRRSFQAANLPAYQQQMHIMEETFSGLLAFLPTENEVPRLLDDIQQQADRQRLEILSLNIKGSEQYNFYTRIPFEIKVRGEFHHLANFMAGISSLDRIITLHDFYLSPVQSTSTSTLELVIEAQTYRYDQQAASTDKEKRN